MVLELLEATGQVQELGAILYVLYFVYKELRWTPLSTAGEWMAPTILGLTGVISLLNTGFESPTTIEIVLVVAAIAVALACGILAGKAARFRPLSDRNRKALQRRGERRSRARTLPVIEIRTGWIGALLWALTLATRYGAEYLGEHLHATLATTTGLTLLLVAVNGAGRAAVISLRTATGKRVPVL